MEFMFQSANSFNQNISNWDVRKVTSFSNFMALKTFSDYSKENYNALLNGWASQAVLTGKTIHFGSIKYTTAGQNARNTLIAAKGWTIYDGGITP
jgi:surface protein